MDYIPRAKTLADKANIPEDPDEPFTQLSKKQIYRAIIEYYRRYTNIDPICYQIERDGSKYEIPTTAHEPEDFSYDAFEDLGVSYSNYGYDVMKQVGMDTSEIWNGESIICEFREGTFNIGKTDYYTSTIFSRLLYIESANALLEAGGQTESIEEDGMSLRGDMLSKEEDLFCTPSFSTGMSSGGLLVAKHEDEWKMLFAKRSMKPMINKGMVSAAPNGGVEYADFEDGDPINTCLRREFSEELFTDEEIGKKIFDEKVQSYNTGTIWNLRSGNVSASSVMYTDHDGFDRIVDKDQTNFEFSELIEVPIMDAERITELMRPGNFSPSVVPLVIKGLKHFDYKEDTPDLPYDIRRID